MRTCFLNHINIFALLNCIDGKNLVIISDRSYFPNYYLFFFHQGELGVHIPCKTSHPNVTDSSDPVEGSNITLMCRVIFPEVKYAAPPEWAYQIKNSAKMQVIDETNLPEGLRKNLNLFLENFY